MRDRAGETLSQPTAEELAADQMVLQGVLRRLCMESGKSVVIVDQIPAKGKESKEDNEVGRVLPMTASGLEYFVDVMVEVSLQERDGEIVRVFQVMKSNSPAFEVGFELTGNVTFKDFLEHMKREHGDFERDAAKQTPAPETIEEKTQPLTLVQPQLTVQELVEKAERLGFKQADVVTGARVYHNQPNIYRLTPEQVADLDRRMTARAERVKMAQVSTDEEKPAPRAQAARNLKRA